MKRIGWAGLMRLGLVELKLQPDEFWRLTPAELALMAGVGAGAGSLSRGGLVELLEVIAGRIVVSPYFLEGDTEN